jgi:competence protein ComEA
LVTRKLALYALAAAIVATVTAFLVLLLDDGHDAATIVIEDAPSQSEIVVSLAGAVKSPGVYRLSADARLNDAVSAAGGFTDEADFTTLNLAARLEDEQQITIPIRGVAVAVGSPGPAIAATSGDKDEANPRININTADAASLDTLPGIGPAIAGRIIDYREANGPFTRVEELARVDGISAAMVDKLRDQITVGP